MPLEGFYPVQQSTDFIVEGDQHPRQGPDLEARSPGDGRHPLSPAMGLDSVSGFPGTAHAPGTFQC